MYGPLFQGVRDAYGPGVWVKAVCFADECSARVALKKIRAGEREVPGGQAEWDLEAIVERVEVEGGGTVRGSVLYARWVPGKAKREAKGKT